MFSLCFFIVFSKTHGEVFVLFFCVLFSFRVFARTRETLCGTGRSVRSQDFGERGGYCLDSRVSPHCSLDRELKRPRAVSWLFRTLTVIKNRRLETRPRYESRTISEPIPPLTLSCVDPDVSTCGHPRIERGSLFQNLGTVAMEKSTKKSLRERERERERESLSSFLKKAYLTKKAKTRAVLETHGSRLGDSGWMRRLKTSRECFFSFVSFESGAVPAAGGGGVLRTGLPARARGLVGVGARGRRHRPLLRACLRATTIPLKILLI